MDKQMIRAYLWQAVIRSGFCPGSTKDQKVWLGQYSRSVREFWEISSYPEAAREENGKLKGRIDCTDLFNLLFEYAINSANKFNVVFCYTHPQNKKELIFWEHDVDAGDGKYFSFPIQLFLNSRGREKVAIKEFAPDDIKAVVNGLLLHPKAHQHIESPINNHDIRIGGGIDNPFLYLFHLRYQLCPIPDKRIKEKKRLISLFSDALKSNTPITANKLMEQP